MTTVADITVAGIAVLVVFGAWIGIRWGEESERLDTVIEYALASAPGAPAAAPTVAHRGPSREGASTKLAA
ncbi:hypothetical protein [Mycolicibacterium sp.]|uniref:hypothetical protein n=1 Tax=Mycolicibacterium sp. TaxID=2320850 RepID=UPI001D632445|nr:hypothetical protein [Mycolicibacterium sp.]MCB1291308.1 hypothetical protein [Mycobacterium sp.]MCB9411130.1 hypothetical protein [Mycolicibacterium sp.]